MSVRWRWELYHRRGSKPAEATARVRAWPGVTIVQEQDRSLLVEAPAGFDQQIRPHLPDWAVRKAGRVVPVESSPSAARTTDDASHVRPPSANLSRNTSDLPS